MAIEKPDFDNTLNREFKSLKLSVGGTQVLATTGLLANEREKIFIYNTGNATVFIGPSGVTTSGANEGIQIDKDESFEDIATSDVEYYLITAGSTANVIVWEYS